ncbi:hypothetical protein [uncultured Dubosiella sp.]|uniref:hypothetical protein n=1 Tax=uncultured Dubosiella sp. TaxID=1937011 RepID=UPI00260859C4|nr:hypothetical protein [uncultured Dubosiella sp.]
MIKKYIKRPIAVEAVQWGGSNYTKDQHNWIFDSGNVRFDEFEPDVLIVYTLEGDMKAHLGDYIVKGIDGEFYPVKKEIFEKTYREAKKPDPNAVCFKDGLNCEEEWIKQEKELEKSEWVCVKKDRLENLIEHSYETSCPLVNSSACHLDSPGFMCSDCEFNHDRFDDDSELPVKNVIKWLEGKEND